MARTEFTSDLVRIAVPIAAQNLIISGVNLVDTVMVGSLGSPAIAAVGLGNQVYFLLLLFLFGIGSGAAVFTAQYWGKGDVAGIRRTVGLSLAVGFVVASVYTCLAVAAPAFTLGLYTADQEVIRLGAPYLRAVGLSYLATAATFVFSLALRSVERVRLPLWGTAAALTVNVVLNYALIFGHFGFPALGVLGAGIATAVARWLELLVVVGGSYARRYPPAGTLAEFLSSDSVFVRRFAVIAAPVVLNEVTWSLGMTVQNGIFARISTEAIASFNILQTVSQLFSVFTLGTANAAAVMIGKKIGEGRHDIAGEWARRIAVLSPAIGAAILVLLLPTRSALPLLYSVDAETLHQASLMVLVLALLFPFKSFNLNFVVGIDRAGGDTRFGLFFDLFGVWCIGVPLALIGAFVLRLPPWLVFLFAASDDFFKSFLGIWRLKSGKWLRSIT